MRLRIRKHGKCYHFETVNTKNNTSNDWLIFWFCWQFKLSYDVAGYFDCRPRIVISLIFFHLEIILPFYNKKWRDECDPPSYGIGIQTNALWVWMGGKGNYGGNNIKIFRFPYVWELYRNSILLKDGTWAHSTQEKPLKFWDDEWQSLIYFEKHPYTYKLKSGEVQNVVAEISIEEFESRRLFLMWTKWFRRVNKHIKINFSDEVGEEAGSWKGGCIGTGYLMKPGEKPVDALRRMERERKF